MPFIRRIAGFVFFHFHVYLYKYFHSSSQSLASTAGYCVAGASDETEVVFLPTVLVQTGLDV